MEKDTCECNFFNNSFTLHRFYLDRLKLLLRYSYYEETTSTFTSFIKTIINEERQISKTEVQQENDTRAISRIGDTETSSPTTSSADSTAIADRYEKLVGLIITPRSLKKSRHANHIFQQGMI